MREVIIYLFIYSYGGMSTSSSTHSTSCFPVPLIFRFPDVEDEAVHVNISCRSSLHVDRRVCSENGEIFFRLIHKYFLGLYVNSKSDIETGLGEKYFRKVWTGIV